MLRRSLETAPSKPAQFSAAVDILSSHAEVEQTVSALRDPDRPDIGWLARDLTELPTIEDVVEGMEALRPTYDDQPFQRCAATAKAMRSREEQETVTGNHNRLRMPGTPRVHSYECPYCGAWHMTKRPQGDAGKWRATRMRHASECLSPHAGGADSKAFSDRDNAANDSRGCPQR